MVAPRDQLLAWLAGRRRSAARERLEQRPIDPELAFARGLALIAFASRLHGWPRPDNPLDLQQDQEGYARWAKLRQLAIPDDRR